MRNRESIVILPLDGSEDAQYPELAVQFPRGPAPTYATELYRLYLAEQEEVHLTLDTQPLCLKRGHLLTLSPEEIVSFDDNAIVRSLAFHHDFFCVRVRREEVFCDGIVFNRVAGLPVVAFPPSEQSMLCGRLEEMSKILQGGGPFARERAVNALRAVLLHAAEFKLRSSKEMSEAAGASVRLSPLVLEFQHLVEQTFTQRKDVLFYCKSLGVTPVTLGRHVKQELGQTIMQVVNERIAIAARVELRSGERSVKEVAFELGFQDPLYFSRFFKKQFGSSPSLYFQNSVKSD